MAKSWKSSWNGLKTSSRQPDWLDFSRVSPIKIGMISGDGIGPSLTVECQKVLENLLGDQVKSGKVEFRTIEGLTIENRAAKLQSIPDEVMEQIKACHVTVKAPTHTPEKGDGWPNLESANVRMRKELDLFANVRPVRIPAQGIDWTFFRENTEDMYAVGNQGIHVSDDLGVDFRVITSQGSERIIDAAFAHAKRTGKDSVTIVTKANIVKTTDGKFLDVARKVAERYPGINWDGWYIDIMTAALINPGPSETVPGLGVAQPLRRHPHRRSGPGPGWRRHRRRSNIGKAYAMFEAIHGSAPRMVREGRAQYADPSSMIRAGAMLMEHIGFPDIGSKLHKALDVCGQYERRIVMTGRDTGATGAEFGQYLMDTVADSSIEGQVGRVRPRLAPGGRPRLPWSGRCTNNSPDGPPSRL